MLVLSVLCVLVEKIQSKKGKLVVYLGSILLSIFTPDAVINSANIKFMFPYFVIGYKLYEYRPQFEAILTRFLARGKMKLIFMLLLNMTFVLGLCFYRTEWQIDISEFSVWGKSVTPQLGIVCGRFIVGLVGSLAVTVDIRLLCKICRGGIELSEMGRRQFYGNLHRPYIYH